MLTNRPRKLKLRDSGYKVSKTHLTEFEVLTRARHFDINSLYKRKRAVCVLPFDPSMLHIVGRHPN